MILARAAFSSFSVMASAKQSEQIALIRDITRPELQRIRRADGKVVVYDVIRAVGASAQGMPNDLREVDRNAP